MNGSVHLLHVGTKVFAEYSISLKISVVHHKSFGVLEVLGKERLNAIETRLYIDDSILQQYKTVDQYSPVDYILERIYIAKYNSDSRIIELDFRCEDSHITCPRPSGLKPYIRHAPRKSFVETEEDVVTFLAAAVVSKNLTGEQHEAVQRTIQSVSLPVDAPFPAHSEVAPIGRLVGSRSFSELPKAGIADDDDETDADLFIAPKMIRGCSYDSPRLHTSPRNFPSASGSPSNHRTRAPLPRSGSTSQVSSPTAKSSAGIADVALSVPTPLAAMDSPKSSKHRRASSLNVLDSFAEALARGLGLHAASDDDSTSATRGIARQSTGKITGCVEGGEEEVKKGLADRVDTASTEDSDTPAPHLSIYVDTRSTSSNGLLSGSSFKRVPHTPPLSPRVTFDYSYDGGPFPPAWGTAGRPPSPGFDRLCISRSSSNQHLPMSPSNKSERGAQWSTSTTSTSPTAASASSARSSLFFPTQVPSFLQSPGGGSVDSRRTDQTDKGSVSLSGGSSSGCVSEKKLGSPPSTTTEKAPSRSASPSFLRSLSPWGSSGSNKVIPGTWEEENSF